MIDEAGRVGIHPIVILTISDYFSRMQVNSNGKINRVFGGLLGQNLGNKIEIFSSFEFYNQSEDDSQINLDFAYIDERRKLTEQLFPNYEILGFFMTNSNTSPDEKAAEEVLKAMEFFGVVDPLCLILSTDLAGAEELPVAVYKIDKTQHKFQKMDHIIEGYESERICLDTVTKSTDFQNNESAMIQNMHTLRSALDMLKGNLKLIQSALNDPIFNSDPHFLQMIDELVKNYPNVCSTDLVNMLADKEEEILILNNICANSVDVSLQGRVDCYNFMEDRRHNPIMFGFK